MLGLLAGVTALLVAALVAALVAPLVSSRGGREAPPRPAPPARAAGRDIPLLDGRLGVVAPPGWEALDSSTDVATLRVPLREATGRRLVSTMVVVALPGGASLDATLADGGTRFQVATPGGTIEATAVPGTPLGRVMAGIVRPSATLTFAFSVSALDGGEIEVTTLQQLFTEQVAPQFRFP